MRTYLFLFLILLSFADCLKAQKTMNLRTLAAESKDVRNTTPARDIEETENGLIVTYQFCNIILLDDQLYAGATFLKMDGFWPNSTVGEPSVLSRWDTFVVPDANAKVVVSDSSYVDLPMELSPARPLLSNSGDESYTRDNVLPIEGYRGFFPAGSISATRYYSYRGQPLMDICVTPVQYDYENKKVRVFTKIQYNILYDVASLDKSLSRYSKERISGNSLLDNIALNAPTRSSAKVLRNTTSADTISNKYLIVSVPKYATAVNKFAEWKRTLGFDVQIEMRESWDSTEVKNVVHNAYRTDSIRYLLIIGGNDDVPGIRIVQFINNKFRDFYTDLYYGCMNNSYSADIYRGRIPVSTSADAEIVVDKIINYERYPVDDERFYKTGVHCAYFQDEGRDSLEDRRFVLTSEILRDSMLNDTTFCLIDSIHRGYCTEDNIYPKYWNLENFADGGEIPLELQKPTFAWDGNATDISYYINQKALYVLMRDHGLADKWQRPEFGIDDMDGLNNGSYLPVVFSI